MLWLALIVLTCMILFFGWITDTVYPEMWRVGLEFDEPPTRGEVWSHRLTKGATHVVAVLWWFVAVGLALG